MERGEAGEFYDFVVDLLMKRLRADCLGNIPVTGIGIAPPVESDRFQIGSPGACRRHQGPLLVFIDKGGRSNTKNSGFIFRCSPSIFQRKYRMDLLFRPFRKTFVRLFLRFIFAMPHSMPFKSVFCDLHGWTAVCFSRV